MTTAERFATHPPGRMEWHSAHGELLDEDPETFHLHVEFVHAHGVPKGEFTTFSTCTATGRVRSTSDPEAVL